MTSLYAYPAYAERLQGRVLDRAPMHEKIWANSIQSVSNNARQTYGAKSGTYSENDAAELPVTFYL